MGLQTAPGYIGQGGFSTPVELDRNFQAAAAGRRTGAFRYNDFALTPSPSAMQMTIAKGDAFINGGENSTTQGGYYVWSNASEVISWPAAAASPRIDTLLLRVIDLQYGTDASPNGCLWQVHSGTPSGSPVALADSQFQVGGPLHRFGAWWRVADVLVPASVSNLATATVTPTRQYARIGRNVLCLAANLPSDAQLGDEAVIIDDNCRKLTYNGSAWIDASMGGNWISLSSFYGSGVAANAFGYAPAYKITGNTVRLRGIAYKSTGFTNSATVVTLPAAARPAQTVEWEAPAALVALGNYTVRIDIASTGIVSTAFAQVNGTTYAPTWVSLDGITFDIV